MIFPNNRAIFGAMRGARFVDTDKEAREIAKLLKDQDPKNRKLAYDSINAYLSILDAAVHGRSIPKQMIDSVPVDYKRHFALTEDLGTTAVVHDVMINSLRIDTQWMRFFNMVDAGNVSHVDIDTLTNRVAHKEYKEGEKLEPGPLGDKQKTKIYERRYGGASLLLMRWLEQNPSMQINWILQRHQEAEMVMKADTAYTTLADTTGVTVEAFATNIVTTINNGYDNLIQGLADNDPPYRVTADSPCLLLAHGSLRQDINAALRTIIGDNGNNTILEYPVVPVYTYNSNVATDLGLGGANRAMLIFPEDELIWADFTRARVGQRDDSQTDSILLTYQYYNNNNDSAIQKRVITLA